jgi:hypothetical protein
MSENNGRIVRVTLLQVSEASELPGIANGVTYGVRLRNSIGEEITLTGVKVNVEFAKTGAISEIAIEGFNFELNIDNADFAMETVNAKGQETSEISNDSL